MHKKFIILLAFIMSTSFSRAQNFHFFCINLSDNSDAEYIVESINNVLDNLGPKDQFSVYLRGGVSKDGTTFNSEHFETMDLWNRLAKVMSYVKICSILPESEVASVCTLLAEQYTVSNGILTIGHPIYVYWFGNRTYYKEHGLDLLLNIYHTCTGASTWREVKLYSDQRNDFKNATISEILGANFQLKNIILAH